MFFMLSDLTTRSYVAKLTSRQAGERGAPQKECGEGKRARAKGFVSCIGCAAGIRHLALHSPGELLDLVGCCATNNKHPRDVLELKSPYMPIVRLDHLATVLVTTEAPRNPLHGPQRAG